MPDPPRAARLTKPNEGRLLGVVGDVYRFLATGEDTNGRYAIWEAIVPPGGGPPLHVHSREEEGFYILEGEMTFRLENETIRATAGMFVNMPVGVSHAFRNESNKTVRMLIEVVPAGLEKMFEETGVPLNEGESAPPPSPQEIERLLAAAPRYGVTIFPPEH